MFDHLGSCTFYNMANKLRIRKERDGAPSGAKPKPVVVKRRYEILGRLLNGEPTNSIYEDIIQKYKIHHSEVDNDFKHVRSNIQQNIIENKQDLVNLHLRRYEELYKELVIAGLHATALKVLEHKEKLMGLHAGEVNIQVNNTENELVTTQSEYNYKNLKPNEEQRLHALLDKCTNK